MGKKIVFLIIICCISIIAVFFEFIVFFEVFTFKTPVQIPLETITTNSSAWVNRAVIVEGNLSSYSFPIIVQSPYNYQLSSDGQTIGVSLSSSVNMSLSLIKQVQFNSAFVRIYGVIEKGEIIEAGQASTDTYYIEALTVEPL